MVLLAPPKARGGSTRSRWYVVSSSYFLERTVFSSSDGSSHAGEKRGGALLYTHVELARPKPPTHRVPCPIVHSPSRRVPCCEFPPLPHTRRATDSTNLTSPDRPRRPATFMSPDRPGSLSVEWFAKRPYSASRSVSVARCNVCSLVYSHPTTVFLCDDLCRRA